MEGFEESHLFDFEKIVRSLERKAMISMNPLSPHPCGREGVTEYQGTVRRRGALIV